MKRSMVMPFWGWACIALILGACSTKVAGGSVGTDNPSASAGVTDALGNPVMDSIKVRIWRADQNPIANPVPALDTMIFGTAVVTIDPEKLGLAGQTWNIEAKAGDGRCGLVRNLTINDSGKIFQGTSIVSDTFNIALVRSGTSLVIESTTARDSLDSNQGGIVIIDTVESEKDWYLDSIPSASNGATPPPVASYLVVLGTSIVLPANGATEPQVDVVGLPPGEYTMLSLDAQGNPITTWKVTVIP